MPLDNSRARPHTVRHCCTIAFAAIALGLFSFVSGWLLRAKLAPVVTEVKSDIVSSNQFGKQVVKVAVPDPTIFSAGDEIGIFYSNPDDPEITGSLKGFVVHSVEKTSIQLLVDQESKDLLIESLRMPDSRIVRSHD